MQNERYLNRMTEFMSNERYHLSKKCIIKLNRMTGFMRIMKDLI